MIKMMIKISKSEYKEIEDLEVVMMAIWDNSDDIRVAIRTVLK